MKLSSCLVFLFFVSTSSISVSLSDNTASNSTATVQTPVLAGSATKRPDILKGFKRYHGGFNLTNRHYWSSVGFTGSVGFIPAAIWFISFGFLLAVHHCGGKRITKKNMSSNDALRARIVLLIVFTCVSVIGFVFIVVGQVKFHHQTSHALRYVVNQSNNTVQTLRDVNEYLIAAKNLSVKSFFFPPSVFDEIGSLNVDLYSTANALAARTDKNTKKFRRALHFVQSILMVVAALMLIVALLGLLLSTFGHRYAINMFIFSGWLLVVVTFILFGGGFITNNVISDTCIAMEELANNSQSQTSLNNILTCVDQKMTNQTLLQSKIVVNTVVDVVNMAIDVDNNINPYHQSFFHQNQSGPLVPRLCSPFNYELNDRTCGPKDVSLANASAVWQNYTCKASTNGLCTTNGRIIPGMYMQLISVVNVSYALYHYAPPLLSLRDCSFVRETFRTISSDYCPHMEYNLRTVVAGLGLMSLGVMLSLVLWLIYSNSRQREVPVAQPPRQPSVSSGQS